MIFQFEEEFTGQAVIRVVGVGGAGGNAVNGMVSSGLTGVEFLSVNTDAQALQENLAGQKVQIGSTVTRGLGSGGNPTIGLQAIEEDHAVVAESLAGSDMVFVTAGMGGGTGTGAAPTVARIARELGALVVGIVTLPFGFEGRKRGSQAHEGMEALKSEVDTLIAIPNDRLLKVVPANTPLIDAFRVADNVLYQATKGISDLITVPGLVNLDFADVRSIMAGMGDAIMGTGVGKADQRAVDAAQQAISSPLLEEVDVRGARGVLVNVTGGPDMTLHEVSEVTGLVQDAVGADANIIFGAVVDAQAGEDLRVTVIATGFGPAREERERMYHPEIRSFGARAVGAAVPPPDSLVRPEPVAATASTPIVEPLLEREIVEPAAVAEPAVPPRSFSDPVDDPEPTVSHHAAPEFVETLAPVEPAMPSEPVVEMEPAARAEQEAPNRVFVPESPTQAPQPQMGKRQAAAGEVPLQEPVPGMPPRHAAQTMRPLVEQSSIFDGSEPGLEPAMPPAQPQRGEIEPATAPTPFDVARPADTAPAPPPEALRATRDRAPIEELPDPLNKEGTSQEKAAPASPPAAFGSREGTSTGNGRIPTRDELDRPAFLRRTMD